MPAERLTAERPNQVWALDFQFDQTSDGRILKLLHVVDEHTREALAVHCARRIDSDATVAALDGLVAARGTAPEHVRCDNGPELTANALRDWCRFSRAAASYIEPGSPWQNPYVGVLRLADPRRAPLGGALRDARRGPGARRGLACRLKHQPPPLGAWHDGAGSQQFNRLSLAVDR